MAPKVRIMKRKKKVEKNFAPTSILKEFIKDTDVVELNFYSDINEDFFNDASRIVQILMEGEQHFEASCIKRYADIIFNLHRRYVDKSKENDLLRPKILLAEKKLRSSLEMNTISEETMDKLKDSLGEAWKESDASAVREQLLQEKLQEVLMKCEGLAEKNSRKADDATEFGHLTKYKNIILRERDRLAGEVIDLEKRLQTNRYYSENLETIIRSNEESMGKMSARAKFAEGLRYNSESKLRSFLKSMEEQKDAHEKTLAKLDTMCRELNEAENKFNQKTAEYDRLKVMTEKYKSDLNIANKLAHKQEDRIKEMEKIQSNNDELIKNSRLIEKEKSNTIFQLTAKLKKLTEDHNNCSSRLYKSNRQVGILNTEILRNKNTINSLEKDVVSANGRFDDIRRIKDTVQREKAVLRSEIIKLNNNMADIKHDMMTKTNKITSLNMDIIKLSIKLDESHLLKAKALKDRDEMSQETETLHDRIEYYHDQLNLKVSLVNDLTEKLKEKIRVTNNLKRQLEIVYSQKMSLQRNLQNATQERDCFRTIQNKSVFQIQQLTTEINSNETQINTLSLKIEHQQNSVKELQSLLKQKKNLVASILVSMHELKVKNCLLLKTVANDEKRMVKMTHELEDLRKHCDLVGLQMVRRNDEIMILSDKLQLAQNALDNGVVQYNQRVEDIWLLKKEISNLYRESECLKRGTKSTANMRTEILRLQRTLIQERIRVRALAEDAAKPSGMHRWRLLRGKDPQKFELMDKLQMFQRRFLKQSVEMSNMKINLKKTFTNNTTFREMLSSLPSVEVKQKLVVQQRINRQMEKKIKTITAEQSLDDVELQTRQCTINKYEEHFKKIRNIQCGPTYTNINNECGIYSDHNSNASSLCQQIHKTNINN